jgi:hypothetical protein
MEEDKRKNNGGHSNGGRKSKAEEQKLIEKLSPMEATAHAKLSEAIDAGKDWAIKMFFEYMYGKPKQIIEQTNLTPFTEIILVDATKDSNT